MKSILIYLSILVVIFAFASMSHSHHAEHKNEQEYFRDVSGVLSLAEFDAIKQFVLDYGDRQTFRTFDCSNPHYAFPSIEIHLGSDAGLKNLSNDPSISDFNEMVIAASDPIHRNQIRYAVLIAVRKGDITRRKMWTRPAIKESRVYSIDIYSDEKVRVNTLNYKKVIFQEIARVKSLPPAQDCYTDENFQKIMKYLKNQYERSGSSYGFQRHELFPGERRIQNEKVVYVLDNKVLSIFQNNYEIAKILRGRGIVVGETELNFSYSFPYLFPRFKERAKRIFCDLLTVARESEQNESANNGDGN